MRKCTGCGLPCPVCETGLELQAHPEAGRGSDRRPGAWVPLGPALPLLPPGGQVRPAVWPGGLTCGAGPCRLLGAQRVGKEQPSAHVWDVGALALSGDAVRALPRPRSSASSQTCVTWLLESPGPRDPRHHVECCLLHVYCGAPYRVTGVEPCIKITGQNFSKCPVDI